MSQNSNLHNFYRLENIQSIFSDHNELKQKLVIESYQRNTQLFTIKQETSKLPRGQRRNKKIFWIEWNGKKIYNQHTKICDTELEQG